MCLCVCVLIVSVFFAHPNREQVFVAIKIVRAQSNYYQSAVEEIINLKKVCVCLSVCVCAQLFVFH